jgi:hypothetical protein
MDPFSGNSLGNKMDSHYKKVAIIIVGKKAVNSLNININTSTYTS